MKKLISIILMSGAFALSGQAQFVNGSFENWTDGDPDGYESLNSILTAFGAPATVSQTIDKKSGNSALKLEIISYANTLTKQKDTVGAYLASTNLKNVNGRQDINYQPTGLKGYFKYNSPKLSSGSIAVIFYKNNNEVGTIGYEFDKNTTSYTEFVGQYVTKVKMVPDSYLVIIVLGNEDDGKLIPGTTLILDDLEFTGKPVGTDVAASSALLKVYPTPAYTSLTIDNMDENATSIVIKAVDGKIVQSQNISKDKNILDVNNMNSGIYFFEIIDNKNVLLQRGKFSVAN